MHGCVHVSVSGVPLPSVHLLPACLLCRPSSASRPAPTSRVSSTFSTPMPPMGLAKAPPAPPLSSPHTPGMYGQPACMHAMPYHAAPSPPQSCPVLLELGGNVSTACRPAAAWPTQSGPITSASLAESFSSSWLCSPPGPPIIESIATLPAGLSVALSPPTFNGGAGGAG